MKRRNFLWYSLLFVASCTGATNNPNGSFDNSAVRGPEKLRFAVTDLDSLEEVQRYYGTFRTALEEVLEKKIEFVLLPTYTAAVAALPLDQVDLILTGPSEYVVIHSRTNASPVIGVKRPNYHSIICVRADSGIKSVLQLKGKTIAMWEVGSTSGHIGPTKLLLDAGLNPQSDLKILMLKNKGLQALKNGEVDAWGGGIHRYESFLQAEGLSKSVLPAIATGSHLPNDLLIVNSKLAPALVEDMRSRMLKNQDKLTHSLLPADDDKYKGAQLVLANDADYNMIRQVYRAIGQGEFIQ